MCHFQYKGLISFVPRQFYLSFLSIHLYAYVRCLSKTLILIIINVITHKSSYLFLIIKSKKLKQMYDCLGQVKMVAYHVLKFQARPYKELLIQHLYEALAMS